MNDKDNDKIAQYQGVYVQAWVYVEFDHPRSIIGFTHPHARTLARKQYGEQGTVEIDHDAAVSFSPVEDDDEDRTDGEQ